MIHPCRGLGGVMIWMEIRFDGGIVENYLGLESVLNITEDNFTTVTPVLDLREFERFRYTYKEHNFNL